MAHNYGPRIVTEGLKLYLDKYDKTSYLGEPTTNLLTSPNDILSSYATGGSGQWQTGNEGSSLFTITGGHADPFGGNDAILFEYAGGDGPSDYPHLKQTGVISGSTATHSISVWAKLAYGNPAYLTMHSFRESPWTGDFGTSLNLTAEWVHYSASGTPLDTSAHTYHLIDNVSNSAGAHGIYYYGPQAELKPHATKFVDGSRPTADGWKDLSGNGFHGDLNNLTYSATNIPGTDNNDFSFAGTDDYVHVTPAPDWDDFEYVTGSCWIKTTSTANPNYAALSWGNSSNAGGLNCATTSTGKFYVSYRDVAYSSGSYPTLTGTSTINDGNWHYCVFTYDRNAAIYVDGVLEASAIRNSTMYNISSEVFYLGTLANHPAGNYPFDGSVAGVKIYNRGLTAAEVLQNFNAHKSRYGL